MNANQCPQRRIINPDAETCWLNSCLQLVLTAFDFKESLELTGSVLWENLIWLKGKHASVALDPTDVKQAIILTERERILRKNVAPTHTLFNLGNLPVLYTEEIRTERIGQQDCKDFFFCIDENREAWPDVFNLFQAQMIEETECSCCEHISRQELSSNARTMIPLTCPTSNQAMKAFLEDQLNGSYNVENWRDEDGCDNRVVGIKRTRISNLNEMDYLVIQLQRLIQVDNQLHIIQTEVSVNPEEEVMLCDKEGNVCKFLPMAIIHHSGNVHHQTTQGHFRADVKNKETGKWFRTSDNDQPKELAKGGLTKKGYIFLYKRNF